MITFAKGSKFIPFVVFKPTGIGDTNIFEKIHLDDYKLTDMESKEWEDIKNRVNNICEHAYNNDIYLMIDAEEELDTKSHRRDSRGYDEKI